MDKRTLGFKRRQLSMPEEASAMLELLNTAKSMKIPASNVLFDSWFSSLSTLHAVNEIDYNVIGMVRKTPKIHFGYQGGNLSLPEIYKRNKKRRGRSRWYSSVSVWYSP